MSFQWLEMRIHEEQDRRQREAKILERLPHVLNEVRGMLADCVSAYVEAFGPQSLEMDHQGQKIRLTAREQRDGAWEKTAKVEISLVPKLPGLHIDRNGSVLDIQVGLLGEDSVSYKDGEEFLTMEELTRRILDRSLFPKLGE